MNPSLYFPISSEINFYNNNGHIATGIVLENNGILETAPATLHSYISIQKWVASIVNKNNEDIRMTLNGQAYDWSSIVPKNSDKIIHISPLTQVKRKIDDISDDSDDEKYIPSPMTNYRLFKIKNIYDVQDINTLASPNGVIITLYGGTSKVSIAHVSNHNSIIQVYPNVQTFESLSDWKNMWPVAAASLKLRVPLRNEKPKDIVCASGGNNKDDKDICFLAHKCARLEV
jgi:hypothetical protein